jgi:hypothetical protein
VTDEELDIQLAQQTPYVIIDGKPVKRIAWGSEPPPPVDPVKDAEFLAGWHKVRREIAGLKCDDCGTAWGQLHVPGCDMEHCPCGMQLLYCDCCEGEPEFPPPTTMTN